jgi:hypothetical protein
LALFSFIGELAVAAIRNVIITIDTLRADKLTLYGGGSSTPAIDRLAADGVVFERARHRAPRRLRTPR